MRFALSLIDYNIIELRPHFPGYPFFCFLGKAIFYFTNSIKITFSIIGGVSIYLIILFSEKIYYLLTEDKNRLLSLFIFFNPFLWLLSNRYMSDLFGLAVLIIGVYYLLDYVANKQKLSINLMLVFFGILIGVRVSFAPFFIPAIIYLLINDSTYRNCVSIFILSISIFIWLFPLILTTGLDNFVNLFFKHFNGHFFDWGGSVLSDNSTFCMRFIKIFESLWADSLGGWWLNRHWSTLLLSSFWIFFLLITLVRINQFNIRKEVYLIISCIIVYFLWIYFFQNIIYKPRHVIPLIPFILMFLSYGISQYFNHSNLYRFIIASFLLCLLFITINLTWQHQSPTALSQLKTYLINNKSNLKVLYSSSLINSYIKKHVGGESIVYLDEKSRDRLYKYYNQDYNIFSTINIDKILDQKGKKETFFHNPYVNRLWPRLKLYQYNSSY